MKEHRAQHVREIDGVARHILPVSATMVGVCMTVISVVQLIPKSRVSSLVDATLALDNLLFLVSAGLSYYSIRTPKNWTDWNAGQIVFSWSRFW